jgi:hypothetical protein
VIWVSAASASWCRRRVAACRSIGVPQLLSRTGPGVRDPVARPVACPAGGGSGTGTIVVPLAAHAQDTVAVVLAEVADVRAGGIDDPHAGQPGHGRQRGRRTGSVNPGQR